MLLQHPVLIHSSLAPLTPAPPLNKGQEQLAAQIPGPGAFSGELPRGPASGNSRFPLTAHSSPRWITSGLRRSLTTSQFSAFKGSSLQSVPSNQKANAVDTSRCLELPAVCVSVKAKAANFPHSLLAFGTDAHSPECQRRNKDSWLLLPGVYN